MGSVMNYYERLTRKAPLYLTPEQFLREAADYFEWVDKHPLLEEKVFQYQGDIVRADQAKMRPYTKQGLCTHLGMPASRLASYKARGEGWAEAVEMVEQVIYTQKFDGAAAGLLNASIISRDLGLAERTEVSGSTAEGAVPVTFELVPMKRGTFLPPEEMAPETPA